jgi:hypothetical protein
MLCHFRNILSKKNKKTFPTLPYKKEKHHTYKKKKLFPRSGRRCQAPSRSKMGCGERGVLFPEAPRICGHIAGRKNLMMMKVMGSEVVGMGLITKSDCEMSMGSTRRRRCRRRRCRWSEL